MAYVSAPYFRFDGVDIEFKEDEEKPEATGEQGEWDEILLDEGILDNIYGDYEDEKFKPTEGL
jgi:hypothetical protein